MKTNIHTRRAFWSLAAPILILPFLNLIRPGFWPALVIAAAGAFLLVVDYFSTLNEVVDRDETSLCLLLRALFRKEEEPKNRCSSFENLNRLAVYFQPENAPRTLFASKALRRAGFSFVMSDHSRRFRQWLFLVLTGALLYATWQHYIDVSMIHADPIILWSWHLKDFGYVVAAILLGMAFGLALSVMEWFTHFRAWYFVAKDRLRTVLADKRVFFIILLIGMATLGMYYWAMVFRDPHSSSQLSFLFAYCLFLVCPAGGVVLGRWLNRLSWNATSRMDMDGARPESETSGKKLGRSFELKLMRNAQRHLFRQNTVRALVDALIWWLWYVRFRGRPTETHRAGHLDSGDSDRTARLRARIRMKVRFLKYLGWDRKLDSFLERICDDVGDVESVSAVAVVAQARNCMMAERYDEAKQILDQRLSAWKSMQRDAGLEKRYNSELPYLYLMYARILFRQGRIEEAITNASEGLNVVPKPKCPWLHHNLAIYLAVKHAMSMPSNDNKLLDVANEHLAKALILISNGEELFSKVGSRADSPDGNKQEVVIDRFSKKWKVPKPYQRIYFHILDTAGYVQMLYFHCEKAHDLFWKAAFQGRIQQAFLHLAIWHLANPIQGDRVKSELLAKEVLDRKWHALDPRARYQAELVLGFLALGRLKGIEFSRNILSGIEIAYAKLMEAEGIPEYRNDPQSWEHHHVFGPMSFSNVVDRIVYFMISLQFASRERLRSSEANDVVERALQIALESNSAREQNADQPARCSSASQ